MVIFWNIFKVVIIEFLGVLKVNLERKKLSNRILLFVVWVIRRLDLLLIKM